MIDRTLQVKIILVISSSLNTVIPKCWFRTFFFKRRFLHSFSVRSQFLLLPRQNCQSMITLTTDKFNASEFASFFFTELHSSQLISGEIQPHQLEHFQKHDSTFIGTLHVSRTLVVVFDHIRTHSKLVGAWKRASPIINFNIQGQVNALERASSVPNRLQQVASRTKWGQKRDVLNQRRIPNIAIQ